MDERHPTASEPETSADRHTRVTRRGFLTASSVTLATTGLASIGTAMHSAAAAPPAQADATPVSSEMTEMADASRPVEFFNPHEAATVDAIVSRILPGDADDPGAHEAGVVFYIDRALSGANLGYTLKTYTQGPFPIVQEEPVSVEAASSRDIYDYVNVASDQISRYGYQSVLSPQEIYRRGLTALDSYAQSKHQQDFVDLTADEQDAILGEMQEDKATGFEGPSGRAFFTQLRNDTIEGMFGDPMYGGNQGLVGWKLIGYPGAQRFYTPDNIKDQSFTRAPQSLSQLLMNEGH
ncbi:MAG: gluconate 2-dehydrogenase subunit 3 family protein [Thermomicrobiales bacterium]|nr:gluconate 2-dehydrogenase subunit 3 family protein [Thermomicrobiales bacterium]